MKNRLKQLRQLHKWSQSDLARELGVSRQAINGFESGKFDPSLDMAFKIARLFGIPLDNIFIYEVEHPMQTLVKRFKKYFGFERFAQKAIDAVSFAHNRAAQLKKSQVEPEDILIGLFADPSATAARLLRENGGTIEIELNDHSFEYNGNLKLSSQSKQLMELALEIVQLQEKKSIGTEHLLWGLIRLTETENITPHDMFQLYGIDLVTLNQQLTEIV